MALLLAFLHLFRYALDGLNGLTARHLEYYFQEVLQINPVAFLRALRLDGVRRELKRARAAAPGGQARGCVQDVAAHWGFWHLGHFVADYRRMFGERPSETLRGRQPMVDGRRALA